MKVLVGTALREYTMRLMANRHNDCLSRRCVPARKIFSFCLEGCSVDAAPTTDFQLR